jgi:hypothetical protein
MSFNAILEEGVFYADTDFDQFKRDCFAPHTEIYLVDRGVKRFISEIISPFMDQEIMLSMHYMIDPKQTHKWGLGSCYMESIGWCPCNHHNEDALRVVNISQEGVLKQVGEHIYLERFDGERFYLPFYLLVGHKSRLAIATTISVGEMKDIVMEDEDLSKQLSQLEEMLNKLKGEIK